MFESISKSISESISKHITLKNLYNTNIVLTHKDLDKVDNKIGGEQIIKKGILVSLYKIRVLDFSGTYIYELPQTLTTSFSNLRVLICNHSSIKRIPDTLHSLEKLICVGCKFIQWIPSLPNLKTINCRGCLSLQIIGRQKNLIYLDCSHSNVIILGTMPKLKTLICNYCRFLDLDDKEFDICLVKETETETHKETLTRSIKILNKFQSLEILNCRNCPKIKLGFYKSLNHMECINCNYLNNNNIYNVYNLNDYKEWCKRTNYIFTTILLCIRNLRIYNTGHTYLPKDIMYKLRHVLY